MNPFDTLEAAGHEMTHVSGPVAGISVYWCEGCGSVAYIRGGSIDIFQAPVMQSAASEAHCTAPRLGMRNTPTLKDKLDEKRRAAFVRATLDDDEE